MPNNKINCLDVTLSGDIQSKGIAYKDENETYEQFLKSVSENETIIGFEWDPSTQKLGVIIQ